MSGRAPLALSVFSTFAIGGPQVRFAAIAADLQHDLRHAIVAMDGNLACRERLAPGLDVQFPEPGIVKGDTLGNVRRFRGLLRALRPDVLVTSNWGSIEWAMANAPVPHGPALVRHVHLEDGFGPEERDRQLPRRALTRRLYLARSAVALPSRTLLRIAGEIWRLDRRRLHYIPNGIDLSPQPAPPIALASSGPVIGTVAVLRAEKNLARLLRAFATLRRQRMARLCIVGDGPERAALAALADELGIAGSVTFTGYVAAPQPLYRLFDVFALSSDTEQMPLSVIEAMAAGLAIAATDVGDVREMVAAENARFIVPRDEAGLAASLATLLADAGLRRAIGGANRARAERDFDQRKMLRTWRDLLIDGRPPPAETTVASR